MGCTKAEADNWLAHQDDFNALLSNLNEMSECSAGSSDNHTDDKVASLHERSKHSKGRVQYVFVLPVEFVPSSEIRFTFCINMFILIHVRLF